MRTDLISALRRAAAELKSRGAAPLIDDVYDDRGDLANYLAASAEELVQEREDAIAELRRIFAPTSVWDDASGTQEIANKINQLLTIPSAEPQHPSVAITPTVKVRPAPRQLELSKDTTRLFLLYPGELLVRDVDSGAERQIVDDFSGDETSFVVSLDGNRVSLICRDRILKIWDAFTGSLVRAWAAPFGRDVRMMPDGRTIFEVRGGGVHLFDVETAELRMVLSISLGDWYFNVSPDGRLVQATSGQWGDGWRETPPPNDVIWDTVTGNRLPYSAWSAYEGARWAPGGTDVRRFTAHSTGMSFTAAASTLDHTEIVKGFANGLVGISENKTHLTDKVRWMAAHSADVAVVAVSPDGQTFASASLDGTVYVCRFDGGAGLGASFRAEAPLMKCAIRADGKTIVVVETTGVAHVLNDLLNAPIQPLPRDFATAAIECIPAPDWNSLFLLYPGSLVVRSVDTGSERTIVSGLWGNEEALVTSVDGARVSLRCGTELKIWDVESGSLVRSWPAVRNDARMMPDGRAILDRPSCASSGLALFDVQTGSLKVTLSEVTSADRIEVSAEGRWVVASESGPSRENSPPPAVWDTTTGKMMDFGRRSQFGHFLGHWFGAVDQVARVWDLSTGERVFYGYAYERSFTAWAAMPDDRGIVVGFGDGRLGIWELDGKSTVRRLPGHPDLVAAIAVHPNGQTIVSASRDGVLNVCMVESGALTATCQLSGPLGACIIRPDGKTVVAVTKNGRVYVMPDLLSGQAGTNR